MRDAFFMNWRVWASTLPHTRGLLGKGLLGAFFINKRKGAVIRDGAPRATSWGFFAAALLLQ